MRRFRFPVSIVAFPPSKFATIRRVATLSMANPLLQKWDIPPFALIQPEQFAPAFKQAQEEHTIELNNIAANPEEPSFENTVAALDSAGALLTRVSDVFHNLCSSFRYASRFNIFLIKEPYSLRSSSELQEVEVNLAAPLSAHALAAYHTPGLFDRLDKVYRARSGLGLTPSKLQLVERLHTDFVRAGSRLDAAGKARCVEIGEQLATRMTRFTQVRLSDETKSFFRSQS